MKQNVRGSLLAQMNILDALIQDRKALRYAKKIFSAKKYVDEVFTRESFHSKIFQKISLYYNKQGLKWKPINSASQI